MVVSSWTAKGKAKGDSQATTRVQFDGANCTCVNCSTHLRYPERAGQPRIPGDQVHVMAMRTFGVTVASHNFCRFGAACKRLTPYMLGRHTTTWLMHLGDDAHQIRSSVVGARRKGRHRHLVDWIRVIATNPLGRFFRTSHSFQCTGLIAWRSPGAPSDRHSRPGSMRTSGQRTGIVQNIVARCRNTRAEVVLRHVQERTAHSMTDTHRNWSSCK